MERARVFCVEPPKSFVRRLVYIDFLGEVSVPRRNDNQAFTRFDPATRILSAMGISHQLTADSSGSLDLSGLKCRNDNRFQNL